MKYYLLRAEISLDRGSCYYETEFQYDEDQDTYIHLRSKEDGNIWGFPKKFLGKLRENQNPKGPVEMKILTDAANYDYHTKRLKKEAHKVAVALSEKLKDSARFMFEVS